MSFAPLQSLLGGAAHRAGISRDLAVSEALRAANVELERQFGQDYGKFAEAIAVRPDGRLVIACRSPAVAQTLRMRERLIVPAIVRASPQANVRRIVLTPRSQSDLNRYLAEASAPTTLPDSS